MNMSLKTLDCFSALALRTTADRNHANSLYLQEIIFSLAKAEVCLFFI